MFESPRRLGNLLPDPASSADSLAVAIACINIRVHVKIPNTGSDVLAWTHETTAYIDREGKCCSCG